MCNRTELARRVARIEQAKAPRTPLAWSPWQRILTAEEDHLCAKLSARMARRWPFQPVGDDPAGWVELCEDDRERELLAGIRTKAERHGPPGYPLRLYLADLTL
jgi:hypothetical protein